MTGHDESTVVEVYWRPGCPYCASLRRRLARRGVPAQWHNIWADDTARAFVRSVNTGNETVPTVRVGECTLTNPNWHELATVLPPGPWHAAPPHAAGSRRRAALSWLPVGLAVAASLTLEALGHSGVSWALDAVALAAWALGRPVRR